MENKITNRAKMSNKRCIKARLQYLQRRCKVSEATWRARTTSREKWFENDGFCPCTNNKQLVNEAANDSPRVSWQDRKIPPALGTNQIAEFGGLRPLASFIIIIIIIIILLLLQNLICHSENIPLMSKGIAFIEESKSQPKRDGFWHRKRTFRTLDFDFSVLSEMTCK